MAIKRPIFKTPDFTMDVETNRAWDSSIPKRTPRANEWSPQFPYTLATDERARRKVSVSEWAIYDHSSGVMHNVIVDKLHTPKDASLIGGNRPEFNAVFRGENVRAQIYSGNIESRESINALLKKPNSKGLTLSARERDAYEKRVVPEYLTKKGSRNAELFYHIKGKDNELITSAWSHDYLRESAVAKEQRVVADFAAKTGMKIKSQVVTQDELYGKFVGNFVQIIMNRAKNGLSTVVAAQNPDFEMNTFIASVYEYGSKYEQEQIHDLIKSKQLSFMASEESPVNIFYALAKEDKKLMSKFKIPIRPEVFREHGLSRIGKVPKTYEEFAATASYRQDFLSQISEWYKPVSNLLEGELTHSAAPDTAKTVRLQELWKEINEKAVQIARQKNIPTSSNIVEFIESQAAGGKAIYHEAIRSVMMDSLNSSLKNDAEKVQTEFAKIMSIIGGEAEKRGSYDKSILKAAFKRGTGGSGGRTFLPTKLKWSYGALGAVVGLAIASTYIGTGNDDEVGTGSRFGKGNLQKKPYDVKKTYVDEDIGDGPYYHTHFFDTAIPAIAGISTKLALLGYKQTQLQGNLFGVIGRTAPKEALSISENLRAIPSLMRLGARDIESSFPLLRVFKVSQAIDFLAGNRNYGVKTNTAGETTGKYVRSEIYNKLTNKHIGEVNLDIFMDAIRTANPEEAESLDAFIKSIPNRAVPISKSTMLVSRTEDGRAYVAVEEVDIHGNIAKGWQNTFDVKPKFVQTSSPNIAGRGVHPSVRAQDTAYNRLRSSMAADYHTFTQTQLGNVRSKTYTEYLSQFNMPELANGPIEQALWKAGKWVKWALSMDSKGMNEGENLLYHVDNPLSKTKTIVGVEGLSNESILSLNNIKYKNQFYGTFGREFISAANRFLESPFETLFVDPTSITRTVNKLKTSNSVVKKLAGKTLQFIERPHLGLNINAMRFGVPQYALELAAKRILPIGLAFYGAGAADRLMGAMTFSHNSRGPIGNGIINAYQTAALAYSKISDLTGLTTIAKKQEKAAPGSTGIGIFALPAAMVASYSTFSFLHKAAPAHTRSVTAKFARAVNNASSAEYPLDSIVGEVAERIGGSKLFRTAMQREAFPGALNKPYLARGVNKLLTSPKKALFAIGMAAMSPFLPGFLGSTKSYAERKAEFEGKKDVAIRKNRGWILSAQPFIGEKVIQYRQHASYLLKSDWENKGVVWESYGARLLHAMTLGMYDRYGLEEYHAKDQPVYESAPYGATVPIFGPIISQTIGRVVKPIRTYHTAADEVSMPDTSKLYRAIAVRSMNLAQGGTGTTDQSVAPVQPVNPVANTGFTAEYARSENIPSAAGLQFMRQLNDVVGFKGFISESLMQYITGKDSGDQFTPYMQSAKQMYNPAQYMWQYQAGDVSLIGGEFLRRIFVSPEKKWEINRLPNELYGQDWLPDRFWTGTTFDKSPMGWLYASRKGWEFQHPEIKGMRMEDYPDDVKLDILKYMAPKSREFDEASKIALTRAFSNHMTPYKEQRAYDAIEQRKELMSKLNAHAQYNSYELDMEETEGTVSGFDPVTGTFSTDKGGNFRLAGISTDISDIRSSLLKREEFDTAEELDVKARDLQQKAIEAIQAQMAVGNKIKYSTPANGNFSGDAREAIVGGLNKDLLDMGLPLVDTGNVSLYNMQQDQQSILSGPTAKYWEALTDHNSFFLKKLIGNRDYLTEYKSNRVFNKEVRMWTKPIEHFLKPFTASLMSNLGIEMTPSFTRKRRSLEQYWDVVKYIKYKTLATDSLRNNNIDEAKYYEQLSRETMVGADPIANPRDAENGLPFGEKDYFDYFSNEPDPKKRAEIDKYLPATAKRIYEAIWVAKEVNSGTATQDQVEQYEKLRMTGGYDIDEDMLRDWESDTNREMPLADYARARFVSAYAEDHDLPGANWIGWTRQVNIDNVELLSLKDAGEQVQDYGYFENDIRTAAFDKLAYISAQQMDSTNMTSSQFMGTILPNLVSTSSLDTSSGQPTSSNYPIANMTHLSNAFDKDIYTKHHIPAFAVGLIDDVFLLGLRFIR